MAVLKRRFSEQFGTRVVTLVPAAIALNIVVGATAQQALRLPVYLDSIGTILVGVLAGPIAGAATGALSDLIWAYVLPPPVGAPTAGPFAITAAVIGLLAGLWARLGFFRSRRGDTRGALAASALALLIVLSIGAYTYARAYASPHSFASNTGFDPSSFERSRLAFGLVLAAMLLLGAAGFAWKRDLGILPALLAGLLTGIAAAVVSAPIAAYVFGGVTGSGADLLVAAFRAAGAGIVQATLEQGLLSDPLDKMITSFVVFFVLTNLPARVAARFPGGRRIVADDSA